MIQIKKYFIFMFSSKNILQACLLHLIQSISWLGISCIKTKSWKFFISCRHPPTLLYDIDLFSNILIILSLSYIRKWNKLLNWKTSTNKNIFSRTFRKIRFSIDYNIFNNTESLIFPISSWFSIKFYINSFIISSFW